MLINKKISPKKKIVEKDLANKNKIDAIILGFLPNN